MRNTKFIGDIDYDKSRVNPKYIKLDEGMQLGYKYLSEKKFADAIKTWLQVWNGLKDEMERISAKTFKKFDVVFNGTQFVSNWIQDFDLCLLNAISLQSDPKVINLYGNIRIQFTEELLDYLEKDDDLSFENAKRAIADTYFFMGNNEKGEELFNNYVKEDPNWGWGWIGWSDQYWLNNEGDNDYTKAEDILLKALSVPELRDREDVEERLLDFYNESDQKEKFKEFKNKKRSGKIVKRIKIGRNEPCPCGSGKKYKKCCGVNI